MANGSKTAARVALALGLVGVACSQPRTDPAPSDIATLPAAAPEGTAWIEGEVENHAGARVVAVGKNSKTFFAADSAADGRYRIGPLPAGEYDVRVMGTLAGPEHVDNFAVASVTATANSTSHADFTQPGDGSLVVRFAPDRIPGSMVTEVHLFAGAEDNITTTRYRELQRAQASHPRGRNTISAEDTTTTFGGLLPGTYTACAVTNVGGDDLHTTCQSAKVQDTAPIEVTLDVRLG